MRRVMPSMRSGAATGDGSYPPIVIDSIDLKKVLDWVEAEKLPEVTEVLLNDVQKLARAGVDFGVLAANTPHIVFDALRCRSPIPLVSIVEVTCRAAKSRGLKRVALFGTRFTMEARFYPDVFQQAGITLVMPSSGEKEYIHSRYMGELVKGIVLPETRDRFSPSSTD
jgi:aspartate racemase